jgi:phosphonate transport system substrate-binding protein
MNSNVPAGVSPQVAARPSASAARWLLYLTLASAIGTIAYAEYQSLRASEMLRRSQALMVENIGVTAPVRKHLAAQFSDKRGRMLADPPSDAAKLVDPETLVVAYGEDSDLEVQPIDWPGFQSDLAAATGKHVETRIYQNTPDEVAEILAGKIHVIALHAADTPYLVNNAGFIPVAIVGSDSGAEGNRLDIAVAPTSQIKSLADFKGHTLTCTTPASITGHRAAVALLLQETGLRPDVDYTITFSLGQKRSVLGLVEGEYEAAALSDDKLRSLLKSQRLKESDYRMIFQSQVIPRFAIGYVYNLQPELAAKVGDAILGFKNENGSVGEDNPKPMHFVAVDYKKDFEFVRKIDESFDPRLGPKPPKVKAEPEAGPAPKTGRTIAALRHVTTN